jgi:hypothetical protein
VRAEGEDEDLEPIGLGTQGTGRGPEGRHYGTLLIAICVALAVFSIGYALGSRNGRETDSAVCNDSALPGDRVIAMVDVSGLENEPVEVQIPLRAPLSNDLLPVAATETLVRVGSRAGHQYFRPKNGRLIIVVEVSREALGSDARVSSNGVAVAQSELVGLPACARGDG